MADIQAQFEQFHQTIRTNYDINKELREKRDIILSKIETSLVDAKRPFFERLMQGSYAMGTGVMPVADQEYDIDVGLRFRIKDTDHPSKAVRDWVFDAVKNHTDDVTPKGPCVRVRYAKGFHVDLVAYAWWKDQFGVEQFRLAHHPKGWLPADPPKLLQFVTDAQGSFGNTEGSTQTNQLRRIIRYLKRWDDFQQPDESDAKPCGLAFTLLTIATLPKTLSWDGKPDDRGGLLNVANFAVCQARLAAKKPSPEYEDVFAKLNDDDMSAMISRFGVMKSALEYAKVEPDPTKACKALAAIFGDDFPVPAPDDTGTKTKAPAIVTSSSSA